MPKQADTIDKAVKDTVKKVLRDSTDLAGAKPNGGEVEPSSVESFQSLLGNIPSTLECFLKVYKKSPLPPNYQGKMLYLHTFDDPRSIVDIEVELQRLANEQVLRGNRDWGSGVFHLRLYKRRNEEGQVVIDKQTDIALSIPEPSAQGGARVGDGSGIAGLGVMREAAEMAKAVREVVGGSDAGTGKLAESLTDTLKAGVQIAKDLTPKAAAQQDPQQLVGLIATIAKVAQELGLFGKRESFAEQVKALKELGLFPEVETGSGAAETTLSPIEQVKQTASLINELRGLVGGGSERPSLVVEIFRSLGPQLPLIVERVTQTVNKLIDYNQQKLAVHLALPAVPGRPGIAPAAPAPPAPSLHEFSTRIAEAAKVENDAFFPEMASFLYQHVQNAQALLNGLVSGSVLEDRALYNLSEAGLQGVYAEPLRSYLIRFCHWVQHQSRSRSGGSPPPATQPEPRGASVPADAEGEPALDPGQVLGECKVCGGYYVYDHQQAFDGDSHICDADGPTGKCGGEIVQVKGPA